MLTVADIRRQNLEALVTRYGGASALVEVAERRGVALSEVYLSQIRNRTPVRRKDKTIGPPRGMGDDQARAIEKGLALEHGWMDNLHVAQDALERQLLDLYRNLSIEGKHELLLRANERHNHEYPSVASQANPFPHAPIRSL